jgi:hypothetical protein
MSSVDFTALMDILSRPRPNGSAAERATAEGLSKWLRERRISYHVHEFTQRPYFFECLGLWLILSRIALALAIWHGQGWLAAGLALAGLLGGSLDMLLHWPLVTWPGTRQARNLVIAIPPAGAPQREVVFSAHYDSKTEPLDHQQRMFFLKNVPTGLVLTATLGLLGCLSQLVGPAWLAYPPLPSLIHLSGVLLSLPLLALAWGLGLNLSLGRLLPPSRGSIDNGAACAVLLALADQFQQRSLVLENTRVTLALFSGEEVNLQGSRAYVRSRPWPLPVLALNLEALGQDGGYVLWQKDGGIFHLEPTSPLVNELAAEAVCAVTGERPRLAGPIISDGGSFLSAGLPASTLGTTDSRLGEAGFHRPSDNPARLDPERLPESVAILALFLRNVDKLGMTRV